MRQGDFGNAGPSIQRPSRALGLVLLGLVALWLAFAVAVNWASSSLDLFLLLVGNTNHVAKGEIWRLFTAPIMHSPDGMAGMNHILSTVIGLFFLAPALETEWGTPRLLRFLAVSSVFSYAVQWIIAVVFPFTVAQGLVPLYWFGAMPALEAVAIAFALSMRSRSVLLFFVLPIGSRGLIDCNRRHKCRTGRSPRDWPLGSHSPICGYACRVALWRGNAFARAALVATLQTQETRDRDNCRTRAQARRSQATVRSIAGRTQGQWQRAVFALSRGSLQERHYELRHWFKLSKLLRVCVAR